MKFHVNSAQSPKNGNYVNVNYVDAYVAPLRNKPKNPKVNLVKTPVKDTFIPTSKKCAQSGSNIDKRHFFGVKDHIGNWGDVNYKITRKKAFGFSNTRNYSGEINNKPAEYSMVPYTGSGILSGGSIVGKIGEDEFNLQVTGSFTGKKTITGTYKGQDINLSFRPLGLSLTKISGPNTNLSIINHAFNPEEVAGEFEYDSELFPVILSYIKLDEDYNNGEY